MQGINRLFKGDLTQKCLVLLAITLPFDYIPTFAVSGVRFRLSLLPGLALLVIALLGLIRGQLKLVQLKIPQWLLIAWMGWLLIALVQVKDWPTALNIVIPLGFLSGLAVAISLLWRKEYLEPVVRGILWGAGIAVAFGFYQYFGNLVGLPGGLTGLREEYGWQRFGFPRMQSVALEPLYFSCYLLLPIGLLSGLMLKFKQYQEPVFKILLALLVMANILTLSRGGLAAMVLMILAIILIAWQAGWIKISGKLLLWSAASVVTLFLIAVGFIAIIGRQGIDSDVTYNKRGAATLLTHLTNFNFFADERNKQADDAINQRDQARQQATTVLREHPKVLIFGAGPGQYQDFLYRHNLSGYSAPNNVVLEQVIQTGLVGTITLAGFIVMLFWKLLGAFKRLTGLAAAVCLVLAAYLLAVVFQAQTFSGLSLTHIWFAIGLAVSLVQLTNNKQKPT